MTNMTISYHFPNHDSSALLLLSGDLTRVFTNHDINTILSAWTYIGMGEVSVLDNIKIHPMRGHECNKMLNINTYHTQVGLWSGYTTISVPVRKK